MSLDFRLSDYSVQNRGMDGHNNKTIISIRISRPDLLVENKRKGEILLVGIIDHDQLQTVTVDKKRKCDILLDELSVLDKAHQDMRKSDQRIILHCAGLAQTLGYLSSLSLVTRWQQHPSFIETAKILLVKTSQASFVLKILDQLQCHFLIQLGSSIHKVKTFLFLLLVEFTGISAHQHLVHPGKGIRVVGMGVCVVKMEVEFEWRKIVEQEWKSFLLRCECI